MNRENDPEKQKQTKKDLLNNGFSFQHIRKWWECYTRQGRQRLFIYCLYNLPVTVTNIAIFYLTNTINSVSTVKTSFFSLLQQYQTNSFLTLVYIIYCYGFVQLNHCSACMYMAIWKVEFKRWITHYCLLNQWTEGLRYWEGMEGREGVGQGEWEGQ